MATIYHFDIELADSDGGVYESLALRVARHPSESADHLIARLLAFLLEFVDGLVFSRGISDPDEAAMVVRDPTGAVDTWIDVGTPDAARLHKASKAARRVVAYTHKTRGNSAIGSPAKRFIERTRWSCTRLIARSSAPWSRASIGVSPLASRLRSASCTSRSGPRIYTAPWCGCISTCDV